MVNVIILRGVVGQSVIQRVSTNQLQSLDFEHLYRQRNQDALKQLILKLVQLMKIAYPSALKDANQQKLMVFRFIKVKFKKS